MCIPQGHTNAAPQPSVAAVRSAPDGCLPGCRSAATMSMIERRISMEKTIENMDRNRLGILIRCLVILLITGVTNSAAVFVSPLAAHFN